LQSRDAHRIVAKLIDMPIDFGDISGVSQKCAQNSIVM